MESYTSIAGWSLTHVKYIMYQILCAVNYINVISLSRIHTRVLISCIAISNLPIFSWTIIQEFIWLISDLRDVSFLQRNPMNPRLSSHTPYRWKSMKQRKHILPWIAQSIHLPSLRSNAILHVILLHVGTDLPKWFFFRYSDWQLLSLESVLILCWHVVHWVHFCNPVCCYWIGWTIANTGTSFGKACTHFPREIVLSFEWTSFECCEGENESRVWREWTSVKMHLW